MFLGLVVVMVLLMVWPDTLMPSRFAAGCRGIGALEETRIWDAVDLPDPEPEEQFFEQCESNKRRVMSIPVSEEAQFLWDSGRKEFENGVGTKLTQRP